MSLKSELNGTMDRDAIERLKFPVAWSVTKDRAEGAAEEEELREVANEALDLLQEAYLYHEEETDLAARFEGGEIAEIVEI